MKTVKYGSTGPEVKALQILLTEKGFPCGTPDGSFGQKTKIALANWQSTNGLTGDAVCGPGTWGKILSKTGINYSLSDGTYNIAQIDKDKIDKAFLYYNLASPASTKSIQEVFKTYKPDVIINAGMYNNKIGIPGYGLTIADTIYDYKIVGGGNYAPFGLSMSGSIVGFKRTTEAMAAKDRYFIGGTPNLIVNSIKTMDLKGLGVTFSWSSHYKTAVGETEDKLVLVTTNKIINCHTMAKKLESLKCKNAINLDGGGSTQMAVNVGGNYTKYTDTIDSRKNATYILIWLKK